MKDVAACDKLRGGGKQPMIRRSPNGATYPDEVGMPRTEYIGALEGTWGSETSQYPEEKRKIYADFLSRMASQDGMLRQVVSTIPLVAASERGRA
jgi:hypothetical protein